MLKTRGILGEFPIGSLFVAHGCSHGKNGSNTTETTIKMAMIDSIDLLMLECYNCYNVQIYLDNKTGISMYLCCFTVAF